MANEMMLTVAKLFSNSGISWSVNEERDSMKVFGSDGSVYVFQKISSDLRNEQGRFVVNGQNVVMNSKRKINGKMVNFHCYGVTMFNSEKNAFNGGANSIMLDAGSVVCRPEYHARGLHGIGADVEAQKMEYLENGVLEDFDDYRLILNEPIDFVSISAATTFILGRFANGYEHWDLV
jgi:hypothetical protein